MIRATAATWLNYATTLIFQILFAANFGTSGEAGAFAIAFAVAVSFGGVFVTTTLTNVLPRMADKEGAIPQPAIRVLAVLAGLTIVSAAGLGLASNGLAEVIAPLIGVPSGAMSTLLALAAMFLATVGISGVLGSIALIRGRRFVPAFGPALPSTLGAVYLLGVGAPSVSVTFGAIAVGGVLQGALVGAAALWPRPRIAPAPPLRLGRIAAVSVLLLLLMGLLPALLRILAATADPAGAAQFDYAMRGMQVALQLLIGGLLLAVLPDWTTRHNQGADISSAVIVTTAVTTLALFAAGSVALVAAPALVELVYERGAFVGRDTDAVALLTRILVPGFVAEGLQFIIAQALLATGRTDIVLRMWSVRFAAQLVLSIVLGLGWGAVGVAAAYSISMLLATGAVGLASASLGTFRGGSSVLSRSFQAGFLTAMLALVLMVAGDSIAPGIAAVFVIAVALATVFVFDLSGPVVSALRGGSHPDPGR